MHIPTPEDCPSYCIPKFSWKITDFDDDKYPIGIITSYYSNDRISTLRYNPREYLQYFTVPFFIKLKSFFCCSPISLTKKLQVEILESFILPHLYRDTITEILLKEADYNLTEKERADLAEEKIRNEAKAQASKETHVLSQY